MSRHRKHIFVCINKRENNPKSCCFPKGGLDVQKRFKQCLAELNLSLDVRANKAGCLDACQHGVSVVIYPDQIWYGGVTVEDVDEIIEKSVIGDEVIERLQIDD